MTRAPLDAELLAAFLPEFQAAAARLGATADPAAAARALDSLRAMAVSLGLESLRAPLEEAVARLDPFDPAGMAGAARALARRAEAIAATGTDAAAPAEATAPPPPPGRSPIRTLIVDDSATMRRLLREILAADPDFAVVGEAEDGARALAAMRALSPDLALLDVEMPVMTGIEALRRWALEGGAGAVVIVSSSVPPGSALAAEARALGAAAIVGKPSGSLSLDLGERAGAAVLRAARRAAGLPAAGAAGPAP